MDLAERRIRARPVRRAGGAKAMAGSAWDWELEISAAIAMVTRHPCYRVVLCGNALTGGVLARLDAAAASVGVVLERRIRRGGGWDVEVRSA